MAPGPDLAEFEELNYKRSYRNPCGVNEGFIGLAAAEVEQVHAALARTDIKPGAIEKWFARRDKKVSSTAVINHRNKRCACHE